MSAGDHVIHLAAELASRKPDRNENAFVRDVGILRRDGHVLRTVGMLVPAGSIQGHLLERTFLYGVPRFIYAYRVFLRGHAGQVLGRVRDHLIGCELDDLIKQLVVRELPAGTYAVIVDVRLHRAASVRPDRLGAVLVILYVAEPSVVRRLSIGIESPIRHIDGRQVA